MAATVMEATAMSRRKRGFSLIELLMALALLSLLLGLAVPLMRGHVVKVRQAEARVALLRASHFMAQWRSQHGRYTQGSGHWPPLPVSETTHYQLAFGAQDGNARADSFQLRAVPKPDYLWLGPEILVLDQDGNIRLCANNAEGKLRCRVD